MQKRAEKAEAELAEAKQLEETMNRKVKENDSRLAALEQYKHDRETQLQASGGFRPHSGSESRLEFRGAEHWR